MLNDICSLCYLWLNCFSVWTFSQYLQARNRVRDLRPAGIDGIRFRLKITRAYPLLVRALLQNRLTPNERTLTNDNLRH